MQLRLSADEKAVLISAASQTVNLAFNLLGLTALSYASPVNWQLDPISGREAILVHWSRVPYLDYDRVGDHKVTWELNRHQWLITLGQAWLLTGESRYAATAARLLREWLDANPPKLGINWCSSLELAFRVQAWIQGLRLFEGAAELTESLKRDVVASAALQIEHIARNLSTWFSPNTHLTGEALALLSAGCAWPDLPHAAKWRSVGWQILCDELRRQVRADGVYFEQSAWYQAYTLDFYTLGLTWARHAELPIPVGMPSQIRAIGRALRAVTRPDGTIARLGDDDGGRTLPLVALAFGDMTDCLWRAAVVLDDDSLVPPTEAGRSALLWLEGAAVFDRMALKDASELARNSGILGDGGWITLAERGDIPSRDHWLVFDAGPHGALTHAHSHADALAFDLSVHGIPLLVDPGTGAYVGEMRRRYRSTAVHNTVTVDATDSSEQGSSFNWRTTACTEVEGFRATDAASFVTASHDGYQRLPDPVRHRRTILRFARHYWIMLDALDAASAHHVSLTFQSAPGAVVDRKTPQVFSIESEHARLFVALDPHLEGAIEERMVSRAYALQEPAHAVIATAGVNAPIVFCTAFGADDESGELRVVKGPLSASWRISHARGEDLVASPFGTAVVLGPARFDGTVLALLGGENPHTIVAAGAGTLHLANRVFQLGTNDICVARCAPDGSWTMES